MTYFIDLFCASVCILIIIRVHVVRKCKNAYRGCIMQNSSSHCFIQINQGIKPF